MQPCKPSQTSSDIIIYDGEQSVKYFLCDASNIHVVDESGCSGWSHCRQKGSDRNHTGGFEPSWDQCDLWFVLTSDQVHPKGSMIIGLIGGTYFSHGFSPYSCVFGTIRSSSGYPSTTRGILCVDYIRSSTWYPSYIRVCDYANRMWPCRNFLQG